MSAVWELLALSASLLLVVLGQGGKYTREANEAATAGSPKRQEAGEFRVVKLNQIWEKAQRVSR